MSLHPLRASWALLAVASLPAMEAHVHGPDDARPEAWRVEAELITSIAMGYTTAGDAYEAMLAGAHTDPADTGIAFGGAELCAAFTRQLAQGRLDLRAVFHAHRHRGEATESELDEALASWTAGRLSAQAGIFRAPLGWTNARHAHEWDFINAPLLHGRFLGGRGLLNPGVQVSWGERDSGLAWTAAVQRATGETAASFRSAHEGGDYLGRLHDPALGSGPLVTLRVDRSRVGADGAVLDSGLSLAVGENGTGGATRLLAWDLAWERPVADDGRLALHAELFWRDYEALAGVDALATSVPGDHLQDIALALGALASVGSGVELGVRLERAAPLDRGLYEVAGRDPVREARNRLSALAAWRPSSAWVIRVQYDHDRSPVFVSEDSLWLTVQWSVGHDR